MKRSCFNPPRPLATLALAVALLGLGAPAIAHQDDTLCALPPGMPVKEAKVELLDGKTLSLPGTAPTLVVFWSVFNPVPLPAMAEAARKLAASHPGRLKVVGVNLDSKAIVSHLDRKVKAKAREVGMTFPIALDPLRYSRDAFSLRKTPGAILVSEGRVVGVFSFDHPQDGPLMDALVRKTLAARPKR